MKKERSPCPLVHSLDIFGDRWTLLILRDIIFNQKTQYREFLQSSEKISTNILANRLNRLVESDILIKIQNTTNKKLFDFYLTPSGLELIPIIIDIIVWGTKNIPAARAPQYILRAVEEDRDGFIQKIKDNLNKPA